MNFSINDFYQIMHLDTDVLIFNIACTQEDGQAYMGLICNAATRTKQANWVSEYANKYFAIYLVICTQRYLICAHSHT